MGKALLTALLLLISASAQSLSLDQISNKDTVAGLKEALEKGAGQAVNKLGRQDGFLGNARVRIPLPESLNKADRTLRRFGMGKYADELVVNMNRAAEQAVPEARKLLIDAVKTMSFEDAKRILTGGNTAATDYFKRKTSVPLAAKFRPIVVETTSRLQLAQSYNRFAGKASRLGLVDRNQANIDDYVTQRALDGLFVMIADEEKAIRANPVQQGSKLLSKVFGALLN